MSILHSPTRLGIIFPSLPRVTRAALSFRGGRRLLSRPPPPLPLSSASAAGHHPSASLRLLSRCTDLKMASISRVRCQLEAALKSSFRAKRILGCNGIYREYSECPTIPLFPEKCYIMGRYGKISFPGHRWQNLNDFLEENPLLESIPSKELYGSTNPWSSRCNDSSRWLMKSGWFLPHFASNAGRSYAGVYATGNVGVIKDLGIFAYKNIVEDPDYKWQMEPISGYLEYCKFLSGLLYSQLETLSGDMFEHASLPADANFFLCSLSGMGESPANEACILSEFKKEDFLVDQSSLMSDEEYGNSLEVLYKVLSLRCPQTGKGTLADKIYVAIYKAHPDCLGMCRGNPILNRFLPGYLRNPCFNPNSGVQSVSVGPEKLKPIPANSIAELELKTGKLLVRINRVGVAHSDDQRLRRLLRFYPDEVARNLRRVALGKFVIRLLRHYFPKVLPTAFKELSSCSPSELDDLGINLHDQLPTICFAENERQFA
uniref:Uncharacterized protein n=1 Tax=Leersia perrieri TaxID=77586 RepID=A0A0D9VP65_9ORYZ